jgi:hypothetical protein
VGFFERQEGYEEGDAQAEGLLVLAEEYQDEKHVGWPSRWALMTLSMVLGAASC